MDVDEQRASLRRHLEQAGADPGDWSDDQVDAAIAEAKEWIGGRRWSWNIVAVNILIDGVPSPRMRRRA